MITLEDKFSLLIKKYICGYKRLQVEGHLKGVAHYGIDIINNRYSMPERGTAYTNPLIYEVIGVNIKKAFNIPDYINPDSNTYKHSGFILMIVERKLCISPGALTSVFCEGVSVNNRYTCNPNGKRTDTEYYLAFEAGRFILNRIWGYDCSFDNKLPIFKPFL